MYMYFKMYTTKFLNIYTCVYIFATQIRSLKSIPVNPALSPAWTGSPARKTLISRTISPQQKNQVQ